MGRFLDEDAGAPGSPPAVTLPNLTTTAGAPQAGKFLDNNASGEGKFLDGPGASPTADDVRSLISQGYSPTNEHLNTLYDEEKSKTLTDKAKALPGAVLEGAKGIVRPFIEGAKEIAANPSLGRAAATIPEATYKAGAGLASFIAHPFVKAAEQVADTNQLQNHPLQYLANNTLGPAAALLPKAKMTPEEEALDRAKFINDYRMKESSGALAEQPQTPAFMRGSLTPMGEQQPYPQAAEALSTVGQMLVPIPGIGGAGKVAEGATLGERTAASIGRGVSKFGEGSKALGELPEKVADVATEKMLGPEAANSVKKTLGAAETMGLAAELIGAHTLPGAVAAGAKVAKTAGGIAEGLGNFTEKLAETDSIFGRIWGVAKSADSPQWMRHAASGYIAQAAGASAQAAASVAEGAVKGAAFGGAYGIASGDTPEEIAANVGGGAAFGGGHSILRLPTLSRRTVLQKSALAGADLLREQVANGMDPEQLKRVSGSTWTTAATLQQIMPGLKIHFLDGKRYAATVPEGPNTAGVYYDKAGKILINVDSSRPVDSTLLHESFHALFDSEAANRPDLKAKIDVALQNEGRSLADFKQDYAAALMPLADDAARQKFISDMDLHSGVNSESKDPNHWAYSELMAEAGMRALSGKHVAADVAGPLLSQAIGWLENLGVRLEANKAGSITPKFEGVMDSPALRKMAYQVVRAQKKFLPGLTKPAEQTLKLTPEMFGQHPAAPVHPLQGGQTGNDFGQMVNGKFVPWSKPTFRRREKARADEVKANFPTTAAPLPSDNATTAVVPRVTPSGLVRVSGTELYPQIKGFQTLSDHTKKVVQLLDHSNASGEVVNFYNHSIGKPGEYPRDVSARREIGNVEASLNDAVGLGYELSKKNNLLWNSYSMTALERKLADLTNRHGEYSLDEWGGDIGKVKEDLAKYQANRRSGVPGATDIGQMKANLLNAILVGGNRTFGERNPLRANLRGADRQGIVRSFRIDRIESAQPSDAEFGKPNYPADVKNFSPNRPVEIIGPDGVRYKANHDGDQDMTIMGRGMVPQYTLHEAIPGFGKGTTTYGPALEKKGFKVAATPEGAAQEVMARAGVEKQGLFSPQKSIDKVSGEDDNNSVKENTDFAARYESLPVKLTPPEGLSLVKPDERKYASAWVMPDGKAYEVQGTGEKNYHDSYAQGFTEFNEGGGVKDSNDFQDKSGAMRVANRNSPAQINDYGGELGISVSKRPSASQMEYLRSVLREEYEPGQPSHHTVAIDITDGQGQVKASKIFENLGKPSIAKILSFLREPPLEEKTPPGKEILGWQIWREGKPIDGGPSKEVMERNLEQYKKGSPRTTDFSIKPVFASGQFSPDKLPQSAGNKTFKLLHLSSKPGLEEVDPNFMGRANATQRDMNGLPKSFWFVQGSPLAADADIFGQGGYHAHTAEVPGQKLYDLRAGKPDALGYFSKVNRVEADEALKTAGYDGAIVETNDGRRVAWLYNKQPVKAAGEFKGEKAMVRKQRGAFYSPEAEAKQGKKESSEEVRAVADGYMKAAGMPFEPHTGNTPIDEGKAKAVADWYHKAQHNPEDPAVKASYDAFAKQTLDQWNYVTAQGVKMEPWTEKGQPYKNSAAMMQDVRENKHLWFFPTEGGFGSTEVAKHPLLAPSGIEVDGKPLLVNDAFRAVHDYFGHAKEGYEFGPRGELNAYLSHSRMYSEEARPAMAAETLGQNSWVNFGPHLRNAEGNIPKKGETGFVSPAERPFAEQKATVMPQGMFSPDELSNDDRDTLRARGMSAQLQDKFKRVNWKRLAEFPDTESGRETGYIDPEGNQMDLSGKSEGGQPGMRSLDHREAGGTAGMQEAIAAGLARVDVNRDYASIHLAKKPTRLQKEKLFEAIQYAKNVNLDLQAGLGQWEENHGYYSDPKRKWSNEYNQANPQDVLDDIEAFFSGRQPGAGAQFSPEKAVIGDVAEDGEVRSKRIPFTKLNANLHEKHGFMESEKWRLVDGKLYWWGMPDESQIESVKAHLEKKGEKVGKDVYMTGFPADKEWQEDYAAMHGQPKPQFSPDKQTYPVLRHDSASYKDKGWLDRTGKFTPLDPDNYIASHPQTAKRILGEEGGSAPGEIVSEMFKRGQLRVGPMDEETLYAHGPQPTAKQTQALIDRAIESGFSKVDYESPAGKTRNLWTKEAGQFSPDTAEAIDPKKAERYAKRVMATEGGTTFNIATGRTLTKGFAVSIYPDRSKVLNPEEATSAHVSEFIKENSDLLANKENSLGKWLAPDGKLWLDVSMTVQDRDLAEYAGKKYNQKAVGDLEKYAAGKDGDIATGGTGDALQNLAPAEDRIRLLREEWGKERPEEGQQTFSRQAMDPLLSRNTRDAMALEPEGSLTATARAASELAKKEVRQRIQLIPGIDDRAQVRRAIQQGFNEVIEYTKKQFENPDFDSGKDWYKEDIAEMENVTKQIFPETKAADKMAIFKLLEAALSGGQKPKDNYQVAAEGFAQYLQDGKFSDSTPFRVNEAGEEKMLGRSAEMTAAKLNTLMEQVGGEKELVKYLLTKHEKTLIKGETDAYGAMDLGPKFGRFFLNLMGHENEMTIDLWATRTWNRWQGTPFRRVVDQKTGEVKYRLPDVPTDAERELAFQAFRGIAEKASEELGEKIDPMDVQATLWFYEKDLYAAQGVKVDRGTFSQAAKDYQKDPAHLKKVVSGAKKGWNPNQMELIEK